MQMDTKYLIPSFSHSGDAGLPVRRLAGVLFGRLGLHPGNRNCRRQGSFTDPTQ